MTCALSSVLNSLTEAVPTTSHGESSRPPNMFGGTVFHFK